MTSPEGRLSRWRAERYQQPIYGGRDPSLRDLVLEAEEVRIWLDDTEPDDDERRSFFQAPLDPDQALWESAERADRQYKAKITGDPLADQWERDLAAGRDPDLEMR